MPIRLSIVRSFRLVPCLLTAGLALALSGTAGAADWDYRNGVQGRGYVICDAIRERLNSYQWTQESAADKQGLYVWSVVASYPGWKEPPWQELDAKKHQELIREMLTYNEITVFGKKFRTETMKASVEKAVDAKMKLDHRLLIWKTHLIKWLDERPAPPGEQNVVNLSFPLAPDAMQRAKQGQPGKPVVEPQGLTLLANDHRTGLDPRLSEHVAKRIGAVLLFNQEPHYVSVMSQGEDVLLYRNSATGPRLFCYLNLNSAK